MSHEYGPLTGPLTVPVGGSVSAEVVVSCPSDHPDNRCPDQVLTGFVDGEQVFEEFYGITRGGDATISIPPAGISFDIPGVYTFSVETTDGYSDSETVVAYDPNTQPTDACEYTSSDLPPSRTAAQNAIEDYNRDDLSPNALGHILSAYSNDRVLDWCGPGSSDVAITDCSIPQMVEVGDVGTISVTVENTGDTAVDGSVMLFIEENVHASEFMTVPAGESVTADFELQFALPGERDVSVGFD